MNPESTPTVPKRAVEKPRLICPAGRLPCVEGVAEASGQQDKKEAKPEAHPAAEQDQKRRAEQDIAEEVLAVGVQGSMP